MYIFAAFLIGLDDIYFFEVMYSNFKIPANNLNIEYDFLIFGSGDSISILFLRW